MGKNVINFSFIIPHKNTPILLKRCIDSIPLREDIQIIVIDDNSSPTIVNIDEIRNYRTGNYEVYIIQDNKGAGRARNEGLKYAKGRWLVFADADDEYTIMFSQLLDKYCQVDNVDMVYFCCNGLDEYNNWINQYSAGLKSVEKNIRYNSWVPWNKLYSSKLVKLHRILFQEIQSGNDAKFSLLCGYFAKEIRVESSICYTYSPNELGITMKKKSFDELISSIPYKLEIINFLTYVGARYPRYEKNVKPNIHLIRQYGLFAYIKYIYYYRMWRKVEPIYEEIRIKGLR